MRLSILIPTYNDECLELVRTLQVQAEKCLGDEYEIIVADDGSDDEEIKEINKNINELKNCRIISRKKNVGRAAIRNFLANESQGEYMLFIDGDLTVDKKDYIKEYTNHFGKSVVYGGYKISGKSNKLRYKYEVACRNNHTLERRQEKPYKDFHTSNFMAKRDIMLEIPFDERFNEYGYEDVFWGKKIKEKKIGIIHIDNPLCFERYEENEVFLRKTDESIKTLVRFKDELKEYSVLLDYSILINKLKLGWLFKILYLLLNKPVKKNLLGNKPSVFLFNIYKILKINEIT